MLFCSYIFNPFFYCESKTALRTKAISDFHFICSAGPCKLFGMRLTLVKLTGLILIGLI